MSSPRAGERARWRTSRPRTTSRRYVWVFFEHPTRAVRPRYAVSTRTRPHARPSPDARLTATLRFPPRHGRHIPQAFSPLNFGDLDVEQQADALFSKVRLPSGFASPRSPRPPRRPTLAPPHVASFSESANTSLRVFVDRRKHAPLTPFSSTPRAPRSSATRNRDRCARSPRARSRRFSMNPTSARTRYVPAPRTSRDTPRTPVSSFETNPSRSHRTWHPKNARGVAPSTHAAQPERHTWRISESERFFVFRTTFRFGDEAFSLARAETRSIALFPARSRDRCAVPPSVST